MCHLPSVTAQERERLPGLAWEDKSHHFVVTAHCFGGLSTPREGVRQADRQASDPAGMRALVSFTISQLPPWESRPSRRPSRHAVGSGALQPSLGQVSDCMCSWGGQGKK